MNEPIVGGDAPVATSTALPTPRAARPWLSRTTSRGKNVPEDRKTNGVAGVVTDTRSIVPSPSKSHRYAVGTTPVTVASKLTVNGALPTEGDAENWIVGVAVGRTVIVIGAVITESPESSTRRTAMYVPGSS